MDQTPALSESLKSLFSLDAALPGLIPGGLTYGLGKAGTPRPYGLLSILLGETQRQTGRLYTQDYEVAIDVYAGQQLAGAGAIQSRLEKLLSRYTKLPLLTDNAWTLHCVLEAAPVGEDLERYHEGNVLIAHVRWTICLQEQLPQ